MEERYEAAAKSVMCRPELPCTASPPGDKNKSKSKVIVYDVSIRTVITPVCVHERSECPLMEEADNKTQSRFQLASGEVTYFRPDSPRNIIPGTSGGGTSTRSKCLSPDPCSTPRSRKENTKKSQRPDTEWDERPNSSSSQVYSASNSCRGVLTKVEGRGQINGCEIPNQLGNRPVSVDFLLTLEEHQNSSTHRNSLNVSPASNLSESLVVDDESSYPLTSLESSSSRTPIDDSDDSGMSPSMETSSPKNALVVSTLGQYENEKYKREVHVSVNSKRKFQQLNSGSESSSSGAPSQDISTSDLRSLMEDSERDILEDAVERRKSLIDAATASDVPKFKWGDLDDEDLEQLQAGATNPEPECPLLFTVERKVVFSHTVQYTQDNTCQNDPQQVATPDVLQDVQGFGSPVVFPDAEENYSSEQPKFPRFMLPSPLIQESTKVEVGGDSVVIRTSVADGEKIIDVNVEGLLTEANDTVEQTHAGKAVDLNATSGDQVLSGLALMTMGHVVFGLTPSAAMGGRLADIGIGLKGVESAGKEGDHLDRSCKESQERNTEASQVSFEKQPDEEGAGPLDEDPIQDGSALGPEDPPNNLVGKTESSEAVDLCGDSDEYAKVEGVLESEEKLLRGDTEVVVSSSADALAMVRVLVDASGLSMEEDDDAGQGAPLVSSYEQQQLDSETPDNSLILENSDDREGKERFRQRLWCYLFENLNRSIDELYFLCELESDVEQIKEALLVLDEAGVDFKDLKARVDGFDRVRKGPDLPRPLSAASSNSSISTKVDPQQRRPHAIAWEVRRLACSLQRADMLSSSLEALKKVQGSPQSHSPQGRRRNTSHVLSFNPDSEKNILSEFLKLKEFVAASSEPSVSELHSKVKEPFVTSKEALLNSKEAPLNRRDVSLKLDEVKELPTKGKDGLVFKIAPERFKEGQISGGLSKSLNLGPPLYADSRHFDSLGNSKETCVASDGVSQQGALSSRVSHREKEGSRKKGGSITDTELLTNRSIDSAGKRSTTSGSHIDRFMRPTASSGHRVASREKEQNFPLSSKNALEAWKEKRNWEDILSSPLNSGSRVSKSPGPGRKSTERVLLLHDKLMSPERKKKSPSETKKGVDEKQARATRIRMELENDKVQRLQRTTEKLSRVSEWQAVRSNKLRGGMHARQQRGESRHEAHLAQIARRASDESSKVSEVRFITSLNEENKKLSLQQKLQDSETRRAERLQSLRMKQKEDFAREEAAQERRRQLEAERLQRIAEAQRRKEEAKARREEERKAASAAREARTVEQVRKKEAWAKAQQEEAELLGQKLSERLRESSLRRKFYLEQIKERAMMDFDKQDKRSKENLNESPVRSRDQVSPSGRRTSSKEKIVPGQTMETEADRDVTLGRTGSRGNAGGGLITLVGHFDNSSLQALKKRVKKIRQRLTSKKVDFLEPPPGVEGYGLGSATVTGGARSKIGRWMQELGRLQQMRKPGNISISCSIISEMVKYLDDKEPELHAARQQGLVDYIATALPASHSSRPEASKFTVALLRLLLVLLSLPANRSFFIGRNLLPPLVPMLSTALENFSTIGYSMNNLGGTTTGGLKEASIRIKDGQGSCKDEKMTAEEKLEVMQEVLEGLLWAVTAIIGHACVDEHLMQMQEDLADLVIACEVLHRLRDLFALFDRPQIEGAPIPSPVVLGLKFLETLTGPRGKILAGAHEAPVNISGRPAQPSPSSDSVCTGVIGEELSIQKLHGVREEILEDDSAVLNGPGTENERIEKPEGKEKSKLSDVAAIEDKNLLNRSTKFLLAAVAETGLLGLPSLLTAVLLQANPRSSPEQAASALPSNFEEVATSVLRVLNNVARLDLPLLQNMLVLLVLNLRLNSSFPRGEALGYSPVRSFFSATLSALHEEFALPDLRMEFFHLVSFLLSHCTCKWKLSTDQVAALLLETLLLLGYAALLHPGNQAVLRWGKSPTILHKMCDLPFAFFSDPKLTPVLIGTILSVCYGSERNRDVIQQELSMDMLLGFLKTSRQETNPVPPSPADELRTEDDDISIKTRSKLSIGLEPESGNTTTRGRTRHKSLPDIFFPSPKKPLRFPRNAMSMSLTSSDSESLLKEPRSGSIAHKGNSARAAPVSDVQSLQAKRPKGSPSTFLPPSLSSKCVNLPATQPITSSVGGVLAADMTKALPITFPAALALQNRFPESLWTCAEEFFSSGSWMSHIFKSL